MSSGRGGRLAERVIRERQVCAGSTAAPPTLRAAISSRPLVVDTLIALGLSALSIFTLLGGGTDLGTLDPLSVTLVLLQTLPLAVRRVWPGPVCIVTFAALILQGTLMTGSYSAPIGALIGLFTAAERLDRRTSGVLALLAGLAILWLNLYLDALPQGLSGLVQTSLTIFAVWVLGTWAGTGARTVGTVEERAAGSSASGRNATARRSPRSGSASPASCTTS